MTGSERPDAGTYFTEIEAVDGWRKDDLELTAYCAMPKPRCGVRLGVVMRTEYGPLWVGFQGSNRNARRMRRRMFAASGYETDGRTVFPVWLDAPSSLWCACKCLRNCADRPTVRAALLARQPKVKIPPQGSA